MLLLHAGQRLKLTEKISPEDRLVQEATGTVLRVVLDPNEPNPQPDEHDNIVLKYMPLGVWMHMDACVTAPLAQELRKFIRAVPQHVGLYICTIKLFFFFLLVFFPKAFSRSFSPTGFYRVQKH